VQGLFLVQVYLYFQLFLVIGQYVLVGARVVHYSFVAKVARGDKVYLAERLLAVVAPVRA
jgi:hypothetical protein